MNLNYRNQKNAEIIAAYWKKPLNKPDWFTIQAATASSPAEVFIYGPVGWPYVCEDELIRAMSTMRDEPIVARIGSNGGDVFAGIAIMNAFSSHPGGVTARIESMAASIASVIPMGCQKVQAYSNSMMMIHNSWIITAGNRIELLEVADILEMVDDNLMDAYTKKTKIGKKEMREMMRSETYMKASRMKELGFIDEIIQSGKAAKASFDLPIFANMPEELRAEFEIGDRPKLTERDLEGYIRDVYGVSHSKAKAMIAGCKQAAGIEGKEAAIDPSLIELCKNTISLFKGETTNAPSCCCAFSIWL